MVVSRTDHACFQTDAQKDDSVLNIFESFQYCVQFITNVFKYIQDGFKSYALHLYPKLSNWLTVIVIRLNYTYLQQFLQNNNNNKLSFDSKKYNLKQYLLTKII